MSTKPIDAVLTDDVKLPSLPTIALRIIDAIKTEDADMAELAKIVSSDPALASRILKISNSSFYALPQKIDTIQKAVTVLGTKALKNIALSFVIAKTMRTDSNNGFNHEFFWKRAVTAAVAADIIANIIKQKSDDTFIMSLLQDIGIIILYLSMPKEYAKVFEEKYASSTNIVEAEKKIFGYDHQEVGTKILEKWGLPETIYTPIQYHHHSKNIPSEIEIKARVLGMADQISSVYHGSQCAKKFVDVTAAMEQLYGLTEKDTNRLIDAVASTSVEILSYFEIDPGDMKPYSQLLIEANEELGKLNFSYEQLVLELKRSKAKAENLATELQAANEKLRELATKDGLTGLFNHRYFQESMDREISRALRYKSPLSLIIADIDHFKKINDTYGHPVGDMVIKTIGSHMQNNVRGSDIVARYGGEEFAAILTETDLKGSVTFAERFRRSIEEADIISDGQTIKVTISVGVATLNHVSRTNDKATLIKLADDSLYHAKKTGRNRISVANVNKR